MLTTVRLSPPSASPCRPKTDLIVYCHDRMLAEGLRCHLLEYSHRLRITTACTEAAFARLAADGTVPVLVILSGALTDALMQFRMLHRSQCVRRKQMVLYRGAAYSLRALLPLSRWLNVYAPVMHHIRSILTWLAETDLPSSVPALSNLTRRQRDILVRLAHGQAPHCIADRLGISIRTVSTHRTDIQCRLGITRQTGWTLLCAAVREVDLHSGICRPDFSSGLYARHEKPKPMDNK